jgi:EAL domain-containing protein (putative c-di-GMP-specific phosphodiesterase class I)
MLRAIVTLGPSLELEIIAEGIEKPSELERLQRFDHIGGPGYLFARPMPAADATAFGRTHTSTTKQPQLGATAG